MKKKEFKKKKKKSKTYSISRSVFSRFTLSSVLSFSFSYEKEKNQKLMFFLIPHLNEERQVFYGIKTCDIPLEVLCFPSSASPDIQSSVCGFYALPVFHFPQTVEHSACGALHSPVKKN